MRYSYHFSDPGFIRGLLENVGAEIDPIRLIRRIKNGLEIPGLKLALIKILQDFNLQVRNLLGDERGCVPPRLTTRGAPSVDLAHGGVQDHLVQ